MGNCPRSYRKKKHVKPGRTKDFRLSAIHGQRSTQIEHARRQMKGVNHAIQTMRNAPVKSLRVASTWSGGRQANEVPLFKAGVARAAQRQSQKLLLLCEFPTW